MTVKRSSASLSFWSCQLCHCAGCGALFFCCRCPPPPACSLTVRSRRVRSNMKAELRRGGGTPPRQLPPSCYLTASRTRQQRQQHDGGVGESDGDSFRQKKGKKEPPATLSNQEASGRRVWPSHTDRIAPRHRVLCGWLRTDGSALARSDTKKSCGRGRGGQRRQ